MPPNPYRRQPNINDMMYPKGSKQPRQVWAAVLNVYKEPPSTTPPVTPSPTPTPTSTPASYPVTFVSSGYTIEDLCYNPQSIPTLYSPQPFFTNQQQLYYDSALTQYIDWSDDANAFFASTGGTQYYFYGFATFGLGTYGFGCPTQTPTPTVTQTQTPTNTPTPSVSPTNTLTPTPSVSPTSTQTPTPTNTTTPSITPTNTNTPSITPSSAFCPEQFSITDEGVTGLSPNGTYNKLYSYTGGSFNYGYFSSISPYTFVPGIAPDGNNYAVFGGVLSGGSYSCMVRSFVSGVDVSWSIVQTSGDYVFNGGANIGQDKDYFTGQTTSAGVVYPPQARTSISGQPKEFIYIAYSSVCPSPTPSITPTNTQTPSVSPTSTLTPTPTPSSSPIPSGTTEANAYLSAVIAAGGTGITSTVSAATVTLFTSLVSNNLYNKIEVMYPMLGGLSGSTSIEGKGRTAFNITWFNAGIPTDGLTFNSSGVTRNGTNIGATNVGYGSTNFDCNTDATIMTNTSVSLGFYNGIQVNNSNGFMGTIENFAGNRLFVLTNYSGDWWSAGNDTSGSFTLGTLNNRGMFIQNRNNNTSSNLYQNSSVITTKTSAASSGLPAGVITLLGISQANDTLWGGGSSRCQFAFIGQGLTAGEVSTLSSIINTFQTSLGRNTY